jgi:hypothetical protein
MNLSTGARPQAGLHVKRAPARVPRTASHVKPHKPYKPHPTAATNGATRRPSSLWSVLAVVSAAMGVLSVAEADIRARASAPSAYSLFWLGLALIFVPTAWVVCRRNTRRNDRLVLVLVVGVALYLVKCLYSPTAFIFHDEFAHVRTIINLQNSGHLFGWNPEIRVAGDYPGLALVTLGLSKVTGLSLVPSGLVVIGVARFLLVLSVFLLLERLTGSARAAGIGCLIYAGNANFLYWDAQFAYESLALPLALAVAYLVLRRSDGAKRYVVPAILVTAMVVITHHLTAYALFALFVAWIVVASFRRRRGHPDEYLPIAPALLVGAGAGLWLGFFARGTPGYLLPVIDRALNQGRDLVLHLQSNRVLFANPGGAVQPIWERVVAVAAVLLITLCLPFGLLLRRWRRAHPLARVLAWSSILYLLFLPLHFTVDGQELATRSGEFLYVGIALVLASMLAGEHAASHRRTRRVIRRRRKQPQRRWAGTLIAFIACVVIFTGGIAISWSYAQRLSPPINVNGVPAAVTPDVTAAAAWMLKEYGPNHRIATDITTGLAFGTDGDQHVLSGATDGSHVWRIFFPTTMTPGVYRELAASKVQFVVVQSRLTMGVSPIGGAPVFDSGEPVADDRQPVSVASQTKFEGAGGLSMVYRPATMTMVYRSATITIYQVDQGGLG